MFCRSGGQNWVRSLLLEGPGEPIFTRLTGAGGLLDKRGRWKQSTQANYKLYLKSVLFFPAFALSLCEQHQIFGLRHQKKTNITRYLTFVKTAIHSSSRFSSTARSFLIWSICKMASQTFSQSKTFGLEGQSGIFHSIRWDLISLASYLSHFTLRSSQLFNFEVQFRA